MGIDVLPCHASRQSFIHARDDLRPTCGRPRMRVEWHAPFDSCSCSFPAALMLPRLLDRILAFPYEASSKALFQTSWLTRGLFAHGKRDEPMSWNTRRGGFQNPRASR